MPVAGIACLLALLCGQSQQAQSIQIAPFTQADLTGAEQLHADTDLPKAPGTLGFGVGGVRAFTLSGMKLNPQEGLIEVWIKPGWSGADGRRHLLWTTDVAGGRQLLLEKSELGMLRAVIRTPQGLTVSRTDVNDWKAGQWHHVVVGWTSHKGMNVGLPLWVDRVAVDGQITSHGVFDATALPTRLTFGEATYDELIVRPNLTAEGGYGMVACVYRDYFRTAPYTAIRLDHEPTGVPSDRRAIAGFDKQFGLLANSQGVWQPVVVNVVRYGQWAYFDAKPLINWSSSDPSVATIDSKGRAKGVKPGRCSISAELHGLIAQYPLTVISPDKPDLDAIGIELLPRFRSDAVRNRPSPGEAMTARVRIGNFGFTRLGPGAIVRFSLIPERGGNYRLDPNERASAVLETKLEGSLEPGRETYAEFKFPFPTHSTWMKVELDPLNKIDELCEANNTIGELADARPVQMGYNPQFVSQGIANRQINHVGSFSFYDWIRSEKLRMDVMLREAVYPTTGPNGVEEAYRIDRLTPLQLGKSEDEPFHKEAVLFDGGFPINEKVDLMAIDCAIIHEFGHTILSQPDLYGYGTSAKNVFITEEGKPVAGSPELPVVSGDSNLPSAPGVNVPCGGGYPSLMDNCQLWLPPSMAGHIVHYKGYRQDRFWGTQGRLIPTRANWLLLKDAYDQPLENAAVYVYHVSQAPVQDSGAKYFADRPKFVGQTDDQGRYVFPNTTDSDWDDPETDVVDGEKPVWNPFGTPASDTAFTPNVWEVEGLLLLRIVSGKQTEYRFMDLSQFNTEFLAGQTVLGKYVLRTSLEPSDAPTPIVRKPVPEAIRTVNKAPVAVAPKEMTVKCGEEFTIDGSASHDPEGQPLIFRWNVGEGWLRGDLSQTSKLTLRAPNDPQELTYKLWVLDGVRCSEAAFIKVKVVR